MRWGDFSKVRLAVDLNGWDGNGRFYPRHILQDALAKAVGHKRGQSKLWITGGSPSDTAISMDDVVGLVHYIEINEEIVLLGGVCKYDLRGLRLFPNGIGTLDSMDAIRDDYHIVSLSISQQEREKGNIIEIPEVHLPEELFEI